MKALINDRGKGALTPRYRVAMVLILYVLSASFASGQYLDASVQLPPTPMPGQIFSLRVLMSGAAALQVETVEPLFEGPVQFIGTDVRPLVQPEGPAAVVDFHFLAVDEGSLVISSLVVLYDGSPLQLGSWHVAIGSAERSDTGGRTSRSIGSGLQDERGTRLASWAVPSTVRVYETFLAKAVLQDGSPVTVPSLAIPGAVARPSPEEQGWIVIGTRVGSLILPTLNLDTPGGRIRIAAREVEALALPEAATATRAVGSWTVSLKVNAGAGDRRPGDSVSWEAVAHGRGSAGFAEPPTVRVLDPDGKRIEVSAEPFRFGQALPERSSFVGYAGTVGTMVLDKPGTYQVEIEPYPWYDLTTFRLRYARTTPVSIHVVSPQVAAWSPSLELEAQAKTVIRRLAAAGSGSWVQALEAIEGGDRDNIGLLYNTIALARQEAYRGYLPWKWTGPGLPDRGVAALAFLGDDPVKALYEAVRLERWSLIPGQARAFADAAASALDLPDRSRALVPPPQIIIISLLSGILLACFLLLGPFRRVSSARHIGYMIAGLAVLLSVLLALSIQERKDEYFVATGGSAMMVPSTTASIVFDVRPGVMGIVLRRIPLWAYVEFYDGRNAWLPESEIYVY